MFCMLHILYTAFLKLAKEIFISSCHKSQNISQYIYWKKFMCKWTCEIQACIVWGSTNYLILFQKLATFILNLLLVKSKIANAYYDFSTFQVSCKVLHVHSHLIVTNRRVRVVSIIILTSQKSNLRPRVLPISQTVI